ncbi:DUF6624 domain-containing protein [Saccharopolyspora shandongensis]|uniref:DUF6624 domain-containing protein n=1 Tax=Saccharopolyspora shandongensis TaxID=418495 RepID=UPI0033DC1F3E
MEHELRAELLWRCARDQRAREAWRRQGGDWGTVKRIDEGNMTWLSKIIAEYGWPGHLLVGVDGAHAAWLLAQHAALELQVGWLALLREAVERYDAAARDLAYLEDRVHIRQAEPQSFGTQWFGIGDEAARLFPLADPDQVNARRTGVGLPPLDEADLGGAWQLDEFRRFQASLGAE